MRCQTGGRRTPPKNPLVIGALRFYVVSGGKTVGFLIRRGYGNLGSRLGGVRGTTFPARTIFY